MGMKHSNSNIALQAIEFWSTVCEVETDIDIEYEEVLQQWFFFYYYRPNYISVLFEGSSSRLLRVEILYSI